MLICEIFYSLQGEGTYIGTPSIFIRTSSCNMRCKWCDTPYSSWWNEGNKKTINEIYDHIIKEIGYVKHVVISGGEPMIQKDLPDLVDLLKSKNHFVTIETNGTIFNPNVKPDLFSISPKTTNSIPDKNYHPTDITDWEKHQKIHISNMNLNELEQFVKCSCQLQFKFVIQNDEDVEEVEEIVQKYHIPNDDIFLMPEGYTVELQEARSVLVADICKKKKWNFCPRLQINLWGTKRGV